MVTHAISPKNPTSMIAILNRKICKNALMTQTEQSERLYIFEDDAVKERE
jgi:hypothetical protein